MKSGTRDRMDIGKKGRSIALRWILLILLFTLVYLWQRELVTEALALIGKLPAPRLLLCALCAAGYFLADGINISRLTRQGGYGLSVWEGFRCSLYIAFFRLLTLGSLTAVAEVYFYKQYGISAGEGAGVMLFRYVGQRAAIEALGLFSLMILLLHRPEAVAGYAVYLWAAVLLNLLILIFLTALALSGRFSSFLKRHIKKESLTEKLTAFSDCGRTLFRSKVAICGSLLAGALKFLSWYLIPVVILYGETESGVLSVLLSMALAEMASGVMVLPGGIGTLEAMLYLLLRGQAGPELLTASFILYRFFTWLLPCLAGGLIAGFQTHKRSAYD